MASESKSEAWEEKAAAKRTANLSKIRAEWRLSSDDLDRAKQQLNLSGPFIQQFLDETDISITSLDSVALVEAIKSREYTAVQVATAFCHRAAVAHQINNCLHEIFFDEALDRAAYLDEYFTTHNKTLGPLHGLPISLKDQFHVKGVDTTQGYVGWIGSNLGIRNTTEAHEVESQIVTELLSLGAVLYCKTSVPQTLLFGETKNNIIGETRNPKNQNLSCGGSSGGEGALLSLRGSTLGIGTDIGGSLRIPAAYNGIYAIKPTPERLSYRNVANTNPGQNTYRSTVGFMSTSLDGLELGMRAVLSTSPWLRDPAVIPVEFRQQIYDDISSRAESDGAAKASTKPLKLGVLWNDRIVEPHPPIKRGLQMVVDAVRSAGHKVIDWDPPAHSEAARIHLAFLLADGARHVHDQLALSGEPLIPELQKFLELKVPMGLLEYQDLTLKGLEYEASCTDYWNSTADEDGQIVDAFEVPVRPHPASIAGKTFHTVVNYLNYSAVTFPVTEADRDIDIPDPSYEPMNPKDKMNWEAYDPDVYHGAPIGLQIVARKFEEEKILAIAKIVCAALATFKEEGRR
ncbi:hypothetical protein B9Z65_2054 [Elsinoe australis]|uniref:amidase n=1 Tax=Elsinoe australis TaxID=40998 RepID=A0A2P7YMX4_9PEZI|nr:hypothetical protein B9Z65_2054 [Elsinoe australis]